MSTPTSTTPMPVATIDAEADVVLLDVSHFRKWYVRNEFAVTSHPTIKRHKLATRELDSGITLEVEFTWQLRNEDGSMQRLMRGKKATHVTIVSRPYLLVSGDAADDAGLESASTMRNALNAQLLGTEPLPVTKSELAAEERARKKAAKAAAAEEAKAVESAEADADAPAAKPKPKAKAKAKATTKARVADAYAKALQAAGE